MSNVIKLLILWRRISNIQWVEKKSVLFVYSFNVCYLLNILYLFRHWILATHFIFQSASDIDMLVAPRKHFRNSESFAPKFLDYFFANIAITVYQYFTSFYLLFPFLWNKLFLSFMTCKDKVYVIKWSCAYRMHNLNKHGFNICRSHISKETIHNLINFWCNQVLIRSKMSAVKISLWFEM